MLSVVKCVRHRSDDVCCSMVFECQREECVFNSPMRTKCGMFVMYCIQCCMSVSAVLLCVDVLSRGGI